MNLAIRGIDSSNFWSLFRTSEWWEKYPHSKAGDCTMRIPLILSFTFLCVGALQLNVSSEHTEFYVE
jgi:hypothetical protein